MITTRADEIARRRTFAIISDPDAGQDPFDRETAAVGGVIQLAAEVRARWERRRVRSDWIAVERERGISLSSAVVSFEHEGFALNLLDALPKSPRGIEAQMRIEQGGQQGADWGSEGASREKGEPASSDEFVPVRYHPRRQSFAIRTSYQRTLKSW